MEENNKTLKQINWTAFFSSMRFSFILLFIIIAECIYGSLGNDFIYTSAFMLIPGALLCINIILCSILRVKNLLKAPKGIGKWGSWISHLGMLLLIISFAIGQFFGSEYVVYGIPGSSQEFKDGYTISINDFDVLLRDDFTVEQYIANITITNPDGKQVIGNTKVNYPLKAFGYTFYQDSTGWANYVDIKKDDELIKTDLICVGEYTYPDDLLPLQFLLNRFYPDLDAKPDKSYYSKTPLLNNPHSLYTVYYNGQVLGMNIAGMETPIKVNNYTFTMYNPVEYTLIVIRNDPSAIPIGISSFILVAGLFISFYIKPMEKKKNAD